LQGSSVTRAAKAEGGDGGSKGGTPWSLLGGVGLGLGALSIGWYLRQHMSGEEDRQARWHEGWAIGRTHFHLNEANPKLTRFSKELFPGDEKSSVLVPLCGKTHDMAYLASMGHNVVGVDCVPKACSEFRDLLKETYGAILSLIGDGAPESKTSYTVWRGSLGSGSVTYLLGDFFSLCAGRGTSPTGFDAIYDRGALVAIRPIDRIEYVATCREALKPGGKILLLALEHDPFNVCSSSITIEQLWNNYPSKPKITNMWLLLRHIAII